MVFRVGVVASLLVLTACATTGATVGSGVGDRFLEHPPYYAGGSAGDGARVIVLPVYFQRGGSQSAIFDPSSAAGSPVATLLADMNTAIDSLAAERALLRVSRPPTGTAPDVYFGCVQDPSGDCVERGDSALGREGTTMHLALRRPSPEWIAAMQRMIDSAGATHLLLVTLEGGQYWPRQTGWRGSKSVELGSGYVLSLPWLTSVETPVSVLQLTGVLVGRDGRGVKIGAEGITAQRTSLLASAVGAQRLITDVDVDRARSVRREDLPDQPLAWRAALSRLVSDLTR